MKYFAMWVAAAVTLLAATACTEKNDVNAPLQTVIQVDRHVLTLQEFNTFFEPVKMNYGKEEVADIREARHRYLLQLLEEMIIARRAEELSIMVSPEELDLAVESIKQDYTENGFNEMLMKQAISLETWQQRLQRQLLVEKVIHQDLELGVAVTPEDIRAYFDKHKKEWQYPARIRVLHILVPEKKEASRVLDEIKNGADFSQMAKKSSTAPEAPQGGDMGFIQKGDLPEELERPIFKLKENQVSSVVETSFGFHIFKVIEKLPAGEPTMSSLIEEIRTRVKQQKVKEAYGPWLADLRSRYDVTINLDII